jgi:AdoMet-dependent rRNA methyltransferase SPB1
MFSQKTLDNIHDQDVPSDESSSSESDHGEIEGSDIDYDELVERQLDEMYDQYLERKGEKKKQRRKMRELLQKTGVSTTDNVFSDSDDDLPRETGGKKLKWIEGDSEGELEDKGKEVEEEEEEEEEGEDDSEDDLLDDDEEEVSEQEERSKKQKNPLIYQPPKEEVSVSKRTALWFDQPLFKSILTPSSSSSVSTTSSSSKRSSSASPGIQSTIAKALHSRAPLPTEEDESEDEEEEEEEEEEREEEGEGEQADEQSDSENERERKRRKKDDDFEVVPQAEIGGSDEEDISDYDSDEIAQALALGQAVVNRSTGKIKWDSVIDDAYNRFTENKVEGLPSWFVDDEKKFNKPQVPTLPSSILSISHSLILFLFSLC